MPKESTVLALKNDVQTRPSMQELLSRKSILLNISQSPKIYILKDTKRINELIIIIHHCSQTFKNPERENSQKLQIK